MRKEHGKKSRLKHASISSTSAVKEVTCVSCVYAIWCTCYLHPSTFKINFFLSSIFVGQLIIYTNELRSIFFNVFLNDSVVQNLSYRVIFFFYHTKMGLTHSHSCCSCHYLLNNPIILKLQLLMEIKQSYLFFFMCGRRN